ncbi:MAG: hypothetical protein JW841_09655 [Deltaproteobacteria bacterium]|nr:hypothetical protein [Deltaproteobacteria bacterium]
MNRGAIFGSMALASLLLACGSTEVDIGTRPQFKNGDNALTVTLFDGNTGAAVANATVTVRVGSHVLTGVRANNSYSFSNIPDGNWPIFAEGTGYLAFAGMTGALNGNATVNAYSPADPKYTNAVILMYAQTAVTENYTVKVYTQSGNQGEAGQPVQGGQLLVTLTADSATTISGLLDTAATRLIGTYGYKPEAQAIALVDGVATINGSTLIYGATYALDVIGAMSNDNHYLSQVYTGTDTITPPNGLTEVIAIFMAPTADAPDVVTYSNDNYGGSIQTPAKADGSLTINFAQPVESCTTVGEIDFITSIGNEGTSTDCDLELANTTPNAQMVFSNGGLTAVISPLPAAYPDIAVNGPAVTGNKCIFTYNDAFKVRIQGTTGAANCVSIDDLTLRGTATTINVVVTTAY